MKAKILVIIGIVSISALSLAFSTLEKSQGQKSSKNEKASSIEPAGGFVVEEIKR